MKRIILFVFLALHFSLSAAVAPQMRELGRIQTAVKEETISEKMLKAFREEYTDKWLDAYASSDELFALAYTPVLSSLLPMSNLIASEESGNSVTLYSLDTKETVSITISDGNIIALYVSSEETQTE